MRRDSAARQMVVLVPYDDATPDPRPRRGAVVLTAPDDAARERATRLGATVLPCPELAREPGDSSSDRVHRLEALVRRHAVSDRWRDVVVVADSGTVRDLATALTGSAGPPLPERGGAVTVGLPRGSRPVRVLPTLAGAVALGLLTLLALGRLHPLLLPATVAAVGVLALVPARTRHLGRTLLAVAGLSLVLVFVVVAGSGRFPVE